MDPASELNTATTCSTCPRGDWAENMQISILGGSGDMDLAGQKLSSFEALGYVQKN